MAKKFRFPRHLGKDWLVTGVYYDYGNPYDQVLVSHGSWKATLKNNGTIALGIDLYDKSDRGELVGKLVQKYRLPAERIVENEILHARAMALFDRTFGIADSLGNITLVIAVFGIFLSTLAGEISRQRNTILMRCFGISTAELLTIGGLQLLMFGFNFYPHRSSIRTGSSQQCCGVDTKICFWMDDASACNTLGIRENHRNNVACIGRSGNFPNLAGHYSLADEVP